GNNVWIEGKVAVPGALAVRHASICSGFLVKAPWCVFRREVDAVVGFAVFGVAFAHERVRNAGLGHQVAFVCGVDEHLGAKNRARVGGYLDDSRTLFLDACQSRVEVEGDAGFFGHLVEESFSRVRFDGEGAACGWPAFALKWLIPGERFAVMADES